MTTPTQAQIEAAKIAKSLRESMHTFFHNATYRLPAMDGFIRRHLIELEKAITSLIAAAEFAEPELERLQREAEESDRQIQDLLAQLDSAVERCAQVAENYRHDNPYPHLPDAIAAEIRAMKEQPIDPNLQYPGKDPDFVFPEE